MEGMTRAQVDKAESKDFALGGKPMRPRDAATLISMDEPPVILTGEYIPENFLLSRDGSKWGLTGLIDFGDVMTGFG